MYMELTTPQNSSGSSVTSCGPGVTPWISRAPKMTAMVALAGMPSVSSGMNDDVAAALFARLRRGDALDRALAEPLGVPGPLLLHRVGGQRGQHRAAAGQDAEDEAEHRAAADRAAGLPQVRRGWARRWRPSPARCTRGGAPRGCRGSRRGRTGPSRSGTKSRPSASDRLPKVNRSPPVKASRPTVASSRPTRGGDERLEPAAAADGGDEQDAEQRERGVLGRAEVEREPGDQRRDERSARRSRRCRR